MVTDECRSPFYGFAATQLLTISAGNGDGPRWNDADLLATLGVDLPAIKQQMRADFGPHAIDELYRSPAGRRLPRGPLCGPQ